MQTVAITTLGCKINQFESAAMGEALGKEGFQLLPFEAAADIYVINTCTVTAKTDAESRKLIRRARRRNPAARIVVTGCYAQVAFEELQEMEGVNLIIGNLEKKGLVGLLRELGDEQRVLVSDISRVRETEGTHLESFTEHTRAFLQVQNGCDAFCSYCIVPYARGGSRSVPLAEALAGVRTFAATGFQEVVLTGIHLGGYGLDLNPPITLLHLLKGVEEGRLVPRLRVGSVEPTEVTPELVEFLATSRTVCPHFHIPLQSGDDQVLQRMNRNYTTARFRDVVESLVTAIPDVCIGCDIIAGFPGETAGEFIRTLEFIQSLPLAYLHVFPFSPREGTPAATMAGQVNPAVIRERAQALRRVSDEKRRAYYRRFLGRVLPALVLRPDSDGLVHGLSRNYLPMVIAGGEELVNREVPVRIIAVERELVRGEVCVSYQSIDVGMQRREEKQV